MKTFKTSLGFELNADKATLLNIQKDQHQQEVFFGQKMPKKAEYHELRSWCKKRTEKVKLYLSNLENLEELLMNLVIAEHESGQVTQTTAETE